MHHLLMICPLAASFSMQHFDHSSLKLVMPCFTYALAELILPAKLDHFTTGAWP